MMQRYRFVGAYTEMGDRAFTRFGQVADWDEEVYERLVDRAPFIPDVDFKKLPFTPEELDRYADYANRALAPDSFNEKVKQAVMILVDIREKLSTRSVHEELPTTQEPQAADEAANSEIAEPTLAEDEIGHEHVVELDDEEQAVVPATVEVQQIENREV